MRVVLFVSREFRSTDYEKGLKRRYLFSNAPEEKCNCPEALKTITYPYLAANRVY